jgi:membrane-associated phospholipid phosphatase
MAVEADSPNDRHLLPAERALLLYLALNSIIAATRLPARSACGWVLLANALFVVVALLFRRGPLGGFGTGLREIYPLLLTPALYSEIDVLNSVGTVTTHDAVIQRWEAGIFGGQISQTWWQSYPSEFWSTVLHGAYFAYYPIIIGPVLYFLFAKQQENCRRAVLWPLSTFLLCYLIFLLYPVAGPYYEFPRPSAGFLDNPMARLVYLTLADGSAYGAAFPSTHVAVALVSTAAAMVGARWFGWLLVAPALLLNVGVVYCQMHYAVDAIAGALVGMAVIGVGVWSERAGKPGTAEGV